MPIGWHRWALASIHIALAVLLFYAAGKHSHGSYTLIRFVVFGGSIFLAYYWRSARYAALLFIAVAILFNPVVPFRFQKGTWLFIDLILSAGFALTAQIYGSLAGGLCLLSIAFWIFFGFGEKVIVAITLSRAGQQAEGTVLTVEEQIEDCEGCRGGIMRSFNATYEFRLPDGSMVTGSDDLKSEPGDKVKVIYNPNNPKESSISHDGSAGIGSAIFTFLYTGAVAAFLSLWGVARLQKAWKELRLPMKP